MKYFYPMPPFYFSSDILLFVINRDMYKPVIFRIVMTFRHELIFSTEYFCMQVLVCKSSICNTNLFFVLPFSVNMQLTFLLSSLEEVWLLFYMFAFQMRDLGRERKRGSISKRHRNIARKLTSFHICIL